MKDEKLSKICGSLSLAVVIVTTAYGRHPKFSEIKRSFSIISAITELARNVFSIISDVTELARI